MMKAKPLFSTTTAKSAVLAMSGTVLIAFAHTVGNIAQRHYPQHKEDVADCLSFVDQIGLLLGLGGGVGAIAGRAAAKDPVYTAEWLPGPNRSDLEEKPIVQLAPRSYGFAELSKTRTPEVPVIGTKED